MIALKDTQNKCVLFHWDNGSAIETTEIKARREEEKLYFFFGSDFDVCAFARGFDLL